MEIGLVVGFMGLVVLLEIWVWFFVGDWFCRRSVFLWLLCFARLHTANSFLMYFLIFDCLVAKKTMGETFRSGLVFWVFLFKKLLDLNSCEFWFLILFWFFLFKINKLFFKIYMLMCHGWCGFLIIFKSSVSYLRYFYLLTDRKDQNNMR